ncbi:MAG: hypothetical protein U5R14_03830 [Gemmatimonadota bacterium]|nr:hypothetical protein [Gemmatimonadota bacterium]
MSARFRIRTPHGQELSFGSEEMFADFVRSGELSQDDLVYDAATGEWSPAFTHSLVLEVQAGGQGTGVQETEGGSDGPSGGEASRADASDDEDSDLSLDLAPEQTPEEASAAFVKEMEEERASEFERTEELHGLRPSKEGGGLLRDSEEDPQDSAETNTDAATSERGGRDPGRVEEDLTSEAEAQPTRRTRSTRRRRPPSRSARASVSGRFVVWVLVLGALAGGVVLLGPNVVGLAMDSGESEDVVTSVPVVADTEEAVRAAASVRFLARVRPGLVGLPTIPSVWLDGRYLANASDFPEVRAAWQEHLATVRRLRVDEEEHYSTAYLSALDDAGVTGATRTLRLASALSRFESRAPERAAHYDRVEELAEAAVELHDFLVAREADITYEPAVGSRVSVDPILQAAGRDPETQASLEAALDRVLDALSGGGSGPVEVARVPQWTFQGLRDVVMPE